MNLSRLLDQQKVILDANILVYAWSSVSSECRHLLERCTLGQVSGLVPLHVLAEASHRMMVLEARSQGLNLGSNPAKYLAKHPQAVKQLNRHRGLVQSLLGAHVAVESSRLEDLLAAHELQASHGLLTNDALLLAMAQRLEIHSVATSDKAFQGITGLTVYEPGDIGP